MLHDIVRFGYEELLNIFIVPLSWLVVMDVVDDEGPSSSSSSATPTAKTQPPIPAAGIPMPGFMPMPMIPGMPPMPMSMGPMMPMGELCMIFIQL